ncbi:ATP-binding cassette domain-containing protein [Tsukamurella sp. 8F]|uniref:ABC transporter ATP-binding protein n=1 Tax=unclassified Tsukamurella TaxID=2633480 RepID=UPI0023B97D0C|nr:MULTISPECIES: ATP-binding cassette domain-containing protein [unclassified Tsukamurella]MDF0530052.1 ATP-binding cassette domain-containing protein [Tsukamurella sp. 8J]MDF0586370.1 ATP-binding cassette domain-containing protein [Tsukamurella sp. 8F]
MSRPAEPSEGAPPVIALDAVGKVAGRTTILSDVSLQVHQGEALALMGPSGSGKSTLMAILGMFTAWSSGSVRIGGVEVAKASRHRNRARRQLGFGWVGQTPSFLPGRSVLDNVAVPLRVDGARRAPGAPLSECRDVLVGLGLGRSLRSSASVLSGGEQQRLSIARALIASRRVLLADEPTASLDSASTEQVIDALVSARGIRTLVVATHDPRVAARCTRTVWLEDGRIDRSGGVP